MGLLQSAEGMQVFMACPCVRGGRRRRERAGAEALVAAAAAERCAVSAGLLSGAAMAAGVTERFAQRSCTHAGAAQQSLSMHQDAGLALPLPAASGRLGRSVSAGELAAPSAPGAKGLHTIPQSL